MTALVWWFQVAAAGVELRQDVEGVQIAKCFGPDYI